MIYLLILKFTIHVYLIFQLEQSSDVLKSIRKSTVGMKVKHGSTKSQRKLHRVLLHRHDTAVNVSR